MLSLHFSHRHLLELKVRAKKEENIDHMEDIETAKNCISNMIRAP